MKLSPNTSVIALFFCIAMVGCSTARVVSVLPGKGGVIAVKPAQDPEARAKAYAFMTDNCGSAGYEIVEEGENVVGSSTSSSAQAGRGLFGQPVLRGSSRSHNQSEWRISYKCKGV